MNALLLAVLAGNFGLVLAALLALCALALLAGRWLRSRCPSQSTPLYDPPQGNARDPERSQHAPDPSREVS